MEEIIECDKFNGVPSVSAKDFMLYFNLENGLEFSDDEITKYKESDFEFIGYFLSSSGQEQMYWSISHQPNNYALALPLTNGGHVLSMTDVNPSSLSVVI